MLTEELVLAKTRSDSLAAVRNLNLWGSDLSDVAILEKMPNVEVLSLSVNKIRSLRAFRNCRWLTELYLRKNDVTDIMEVTHLQVVFACLPAVTPASTQESESARVQKHTSYYIHTNARAHTRTHMCAHSNALSLRLALSITLCLPCAPHTLANLQGLANLKILWLCDNPCVGSSASDYRKRTIAMLPTVTKLDNIDVTVKERADALDAYGHLSPTHTPNHTGSGNSFLAGTSHDVYMPASPTQATRLPFTLSSPYTSAPAASAANESRATFAPDALPVSAGHRADVSAPVASYATSVASRRAPSNVLYAVLALVNELDGDQLLAVKSEVGLRLQLLESSRH